MIDLETADKATQIPDPLPNEDPDIPPPEIKTPPAVHTDPNVPQPSDEVIKFAIALGYYHRALQHPAPAASPLTNSRGLTTNVTNCKLPFDIIMYTY